MSCRVFLLLSLVLTSSWCTGQYLSDSTRSLVPYRIEIGSNSTKSNLSAVPVTSLQSSSALSGNLSTPALTGLPDTAFNARTNYSGLMINFLTSTKWPRSWFRRKVLLTMALEAGRSTTRMARVIASDSIAYQYDFTNDIFRISLGLRQYFVPERSKIRIYLGMEWTSQFHVSSRVLERELDAFLFARGERRLFAKRGYSTFLNIPLGIDYRLARKKKAHKKTRIFYQFQVTPGSLYTPASRITRFFRGNRLGISLGL